MCWDTAKGGVPLRPRDCVFSPSEQNHTCGAGVLSVGRAPQLLYSNGQACDREAEVPGGYAWLLGNAFWETAGTAWGHHGAQQEDCSGGCCPMVLSLSSPSQMGHWQ